jgi:multidrug transporter EmrE-like cation transporter
MMETYGLLALVIAANVGGQLLFKVAAGQLGPERDPAAVMLRLLTLPSMWGAVALYAVTILAWVWVLRSMPLSVAYSAVALVFVLVPVLAIWLFREPVTPQLLIGAALITAGVLLVQLQGH